VSRYPTLSEVNPFYDRLLQRLRSLPAVEHAGATALLPFEGWGNGPATVEGRVLPPGEELTVGQNAVTSGCFETLQIRLLAGRSFGAGDDESGNRVVIINDVMARRFWPAGEPLGHRIKFVRPDEEGPWYTIVGVVATIRQRSLQDEPEPQVYFSPRQSPWARGMTVVLRTRIDPLAVAADARRELWAIDKTLPVIGMTSMEQLVLDSIGKPRLNTAVLAAFACIALVLALTGIYSVVTYSVSQRTREIGIRMSLGASRREILLWVLRRHLPWILLGIGLGVAGALATVRVLRNLLFGIEPNDASTYIAVSLLMIVVTLFACYLPARRASEVDPVIAFESN
jgi:putative ABC transport system permease protein